MIALGALLVWAAVVAIAVYAIRVRKAHTENAAALLIIGFTSLNYGRETLITIAAHVVYGAILGSSDQLTAR